MHVNAAYTRLTGLSSLDLLGRSFGELVDLDSTHKSGPAYSLEALDGKTLRVKRRSKEDSLDAPLLVSPVGPDRETITHYVVDFVVDVETEGARAQIRPAAPLSIPLGVSG